MARGLQHYGVVGADTAGGDLTQTDAFQGIPVVLTGTADVLNPYAQSTNYMINTGSADACTLILPVAGVDDNLSVAIWSATAFAHSVTLPSAKMANGAALKTSATLAAFAGAGILLRAWQGTWQVIGSTGAITYA